MYLDTKSHSARQGVFDAAKRYFTSLEKAKFVPGETYIPPSGKCIEEDDLLSLIDASMDMWLTAGRFSEKFESEIAQYIGVKNSKLTVSGSAANLLALTAFTSPLSKDQRLKKGDEVMTVAAGFPTTVSPIIQNGCTPVFVDIDIKTHNIDVSYLEEARSEKTKAIMLAHTLGNPFNLELVTEFAKKHHLFLIEDCCDALGTTYKGKRVGTFGDLATLSFYPAHHMTMGEGGAILGSSGPLMRAVESFRDWGRDCWCPPGKDNTCKKRFEWQKGDLPKGYDHKYTYSHLGYNMKATDMQAAIGCTQLSKVDGFISARKENFRLLCEGFNSIGMEEHFLLPEATPNSDPSWFGLILTIRDEASLKRDQVIRYLENHKVGTRLVFAGNLIKQPAMKGVAHRAIGDLKNSDKAMNDSFWIGVWPGIDKARRDYMLEVFKNMLKELLK